MSGDVDIDKNNIGDLINNVTQTIEGGAQGVETEASNMGEGLGTALVIIFYLLPIFILIAFVYVILKMPNKVLDAVNKLKGVGKKM